jgi:hypothetical protein
MTDFRAKGTIMGPTGLTAVFGMGTGVTPPVWSPENCPAGGQAGADTTITVRFGSVTPDADFSSLRPGGQAPTTSRLRRRGTPQSFPTLGGRPQVRQGIRHGVLQSGNMCDTVDPNQTPLTGGRRIGVVKRSAVGTGPLRRSPAVHSQPIDLVVFQEPSELALLETSS